MDSAAHAGHDVAAHIGAAAQRPIALLKGNTMLYAFYCIDKPDHQEVRLANREAHVAFLKQSEVRLAGPLTTDDGSGMIGSLLVVELADRAAAEAWAAADPYAKAGLFERVEIRAFRQVIG